MTEMEQGYKRMTHLDLELNRLKNEIAEMGNLVQHQLKKSIESLTTVNTDLAREVMFPEERGNAEELKIDREW